jgi:hypothetical protein
MKFSTSIIAPSMSSIVASTSVVKSQYDVQQTFCPGAGWLGWGYVALLHDLKATDMPQA